MGLISLFCFVGTVICIAQLSRAAKVDMKINLGGEAVDGFSAEEEILDLGEDMPKMRFHGSISGHGDDLKVFKTQRFSRGEDLVLDIPVPDGIYSVTLLFAETWKGAYASGKRVFDVYMGSKPNGIIKVCNQLDPFRSGGAAGPVRRNFKGIAIQDGLTVALRPIKQNPQIAGIVISGYSYSDALIEDLPTVPAAPDRPLDFSILDNIRPAQPDPELVYDPNLNPKFKSPTAETSTSTYPASSGPMALGSSVGMPSTLGQSTGYGSRTKGGQQYGYSASSTTMPVTYGGYSSSSGPNTQPMNSPSQYSSSPGTRTYRRRLASYTGDYGRPDSDVIAKLENLNSKIAQEQMTMNSGSSSAPLMNDMYTTKSEPNFSHSPAQGSNNNQFRSWPGAQGTTPSNERSQFSSSTAQAAEQPPYSSSGTQQHEPSYSSGSDPTAPFSDAAQKLQAQSEVMHATSQNQHEPSPLASGWSTEKTNQVSPGKQHSSLGKALEIQDPDSALGSAATTQGNGYQSPSRVADLSHVEDARQPSAATELSRHTDGNENRGFPKSDASSGHHSPSMNSYDMESTSTHQSHTPGGPGAYGSLSTQSDAGPTTRDLIQAPHVERMVQPQDGLRERRNVPRELDTSNFGQPSAMHSSLSTQPNSDVGRYSTPTRQSASSVPELPSIPDLSGIPGFPGTQSGPPEEEGNPTPGIHNGPASLEGMCIDNSTHCSCGMTEQRSTQLEECLFVVNENASPMICARRPCSGRLRCACSPGASGLCKRSYVKHILVPTTIHKHGVTEEPDVVLCKRESIEHGVGVLTPIIMS